MLAFLDHVICRVEMIRLILFHRWLITMASVLLFSSFNYDLLIILIHDNLIPSIAPLMSVFFSLLSSMISLPLFFCFVVQFQVISRCCFWPYTWCIQITPQLDTQLFPERSMMDLRSPGRTLLLDSDEAPCMKSLRFDPVSLYPRREKSCFAYFCQILHP